LFSKEFDGGLRKRIPKQVAGHAKVLRDSEERLKRFLKGDEKCFSFGVFHGAVT